jgi:TPR repeat protein
MQRKFAWRLAHRLTSAAILAAALAAGLPAGAQTASEPVAQGLHIGSPPSVLNDPMVKHCRELAARRMDPNLDSLTTAVDKAAMTLNLEPVLDAVATCRAALARFPNEPKVIIAQYNASESLSLLALGLKFPDSEEQALALVQQAIAKEKSAGIATRMLGFYLGSAYEYGVGTKPDRAAATKWYAVAAEAGDAISKRELARLQSAKP